MSLLVNKTACCAAGAVAAGVVATTAFAKSDAGPWRGLAREIFFGRAITNDDAAMLITQARAEDAAIVPMTMRSSDPAQGRSANPIIDQNPMPVAAAFALGDKAGVAFVETGVRVQSVTNVHAIVEMRDASLRAQVKFVKASGGCLAPAVKEQDEAKRQHRQHEISRVQER